MYLRCTAWYFDIWSPQPSQWTYPSPPMVISFFLFICVCVCVCVCGKSTGTENLPFLQISSVQYSIVKYSHHAPELNHLAMTKALYPWPRPPHLPLPPSSWQTPFYSLLLWVWLFNIIHGIEISDLSINLISGGKGDCPTVLYKYKIS